MLNPSRIRAIPNLSSTESQLRFLAILHDYCKTCNPNNNLGHTCLHTQCNTSPNTSPNNRHSNNKSSTE
jgi:hypothetical protein